MRILETRLRRQGSNGRSAASVRREVLTIAAIVAAMAVTFIVDILTPADNVSICFAYAVPIMVGILVGERATFVFAAVATALSVAGSLIQPGGPTSEVFVANRVIAVVTQWMVAFLVHYRLRAEEALTRSLEAEREKAEQQRRFIAILSHEIKTPLTTIDGQAYRLGKAGARLTAAEVAERTAKIRASAQRINGIVDRIELSSAVGNGEIAAAFEPVELRALVEDAVQHVAEEAGAERIAVDLGGLPDRIVADGGLVRQIVTNLLSNAVKYSPPDGRVAIRGRRERDAAVIEVRDHGVGIPGEDVPNVFKPYYRGRNANGIGGVGIGLFLVDRFVATHGGSLSVDSRPGSGTTFTVRLPLRPPTPAADPARPPVPSPAASPHAEPQDDPVH